MMWRLFWYRRPTQLGRIERKLDLLLDLAFEDDGGSEQLAALRRKLATEREKLSRVIDLTNTTTRTLP